MSDESDVTGLRGPSLEDVLDVLASTRRAVIALENAVHSLQSYVIFAVVFITALLLKRKVVA